MNLNWLMKLEKLCIFMMVISLPVIALPKRFSIIGLGNNLSFYFLIILIGFYFLEMVLRKKIIISHTFLKYILLYCCWIFSTTTYGIYNYPYYSSVDLSGSHVFTQLSYLFNIDISNNFNKAAFLLLKSLSEGFKLLIFPWCSTYIVYNILSKDKDNAYFFIRKCFIALAICLSIYAIPEILLFKLHFIEAGEFLKITNPYFYDVKSYLDWYPPAIWHDEQLRSYCIEPAVLGSLSGVIIPFLWSMIFEYKNINSVMLYTYYFMLPIMSKSRTAIAVLIFISVQIFAYIKSVNSYKKVFSIIILASFIGGFLGIQNWNNIIPRINTNIIVERAVEDNTDKYIKNNVSTIVDPNARSNGSRLINIKSHLNVCFQHPIMGTGMLLKDMYVKDHLIKGAMNNAEIKAITNGINKEGIFKYSYGNVNDYVFIMTNIGIVGLLFQLFPICYLAYLFLKKEGIHNERMVTLMIALSSCLATMMSGAVGLVFYILVSLGYVIAYKNEFRYIKEE